MRWVEGASTGLAAAALAVGYAQGGFWGWGVAWVVLGGVWWLGRRWRAWTGTLAFLIFVLAAVAGLWVDLGGGWMLLGTVAALAAWDLDHFTRRLREGGRVEQEAGLVRAHLRRLAEVSAVGLGLGGVALLARIDLGLGLALLLGLLTVIGLRQFLTALRRESD